MGAWAYAVVFIALVNTVISLYYYLKIVKAMYIRKSDHPLPTFQSGRQHKVCLSHLHRRRSALRYLQRHPSINRFSILDVA